VRGDRVSEKILCTFYLGDLYFGIDVRGVQEVMSNHELTPVPLAPEVITGLMNVRGQIIPAVDLRRRLELEGRGEDDPAPMNVVLQTDDGPVSLLVDRIGDVMEVDEQQFETPPETVTGVARDLIVGTYKLEGHLLLELDTDRLLDEPALVEA
jgi:purine-binding chemotaxis protein CheW